MQALLVILKSLILPNLRTTPIYYICFPGKPVNITVNMRINSVYDVREEEMVSCYEIDTLHCRNLSRVQQHQTYR